MPSETQRSHAADSSSCSQLGTTESSRKIGHAHPSRRIALDAPDVLAMLGPSKAAIALVKSALAGAGAHFQFPEDLAQAILTPCRETN